jgi:hypothetical protein
MSPDALSTYLINAVWQAPLVAFTALMIARFAGLAPAGRNRVWLTALAAAALLPAVSLEGLLQATPTVVRIAPTTVVESPTAVTAEPLMATPAFALAPSAAWIMIGLAAAFAVLAVVRLALAGVAASRLAATGRPAVLPGDVARAVERLAASRHRKPPPILATPAVEGTRSTWPAKSSPCRSPGTPPSPASRPACAAAASWPAMRWRPRPWLRRRPTPGPCSPSPGR